MQDVLKIAEDKMKKAVEAVKGNFASVRTGRASPALLDHILVEYYGTLVPLKQLAGISVPEPRSIVIQPYDKSSISEIEKAILKSDLGLTPKTEGMLIRLSLPSLTEERRKELVKIIRKEAEDGRVALRNIRREVIDSLKKSKENKELSEDQEKFKEDEIQKLTTKYTSEIDKMLSQKEAEVMEV